jgi:hypothetical protein
MIVRSKMPMRSSARIEPRRAARRSRQAPDRQPQRVHVKAGDTEETSLDHVIETAILVDQLIAAST